MDPELERLREQIVRQTQLATIGQLSASIAHDLRNPLGVVRNAAFLLKRKVPPDEPKWREYLNMIEQETAVADRIITELLAISQGRAPIKKLVALGSIVTEARSRVADFPQVAWESVFPADPYLVDVDAAQMEQVLRNLFANAIQAMGGRGKIAIHAARCGDCDEIIVADTGPGVSAEIRARIFEPLFTTRSKRPGLGLTICRQVLEGHGGTIDVIESPQGAAFRLRLPRKDL